MVAAVLLAVTSVSCKKGRPPSRAVAATMEVRPVYDEVVRTRQVREARPELIPIDTGSTYRPAEGRTPADSGSKGSAERSGGGEAAATPERSIDELLAQVSDRHSCNIVMGCPAGRELVRRSAAAVGPLMARYESFGRPCYQKFHLLDLLGDIGDRSALGFLRERLEDGHWNARANAALALGRMGARDLLPELSGKLAELKGGRDFGFLYAVALAVEQLGGEGGAEVLLGALEPDSVSRHNSGYTRIAVDGVSELKLRGACRHLRLSIEHRDVFLKKAGIRAAARLRCAEEEVLRAVAVQLRSRVPSVKRAAADALEALTGRRPDSYEQWTAPEQAGDEK